MQDKRAPLGILRIGESSSRYAPLLKGFNDLSEETSSTSLVSHINQVILDESLDYLIVARRSVILDEALQPTIQELAKDLSDRIPNWGVCGATGTRCDGERTYWYLRRPPLNPEASASPRPALVLGSEILLLNLKLLRARQVKLGDDTADWSEIGPLMSIVCLEKQLCAVVDRRLMVVDSGDAPEIPKHGALNRILRERFVNHRLKLPSAEVLEVSDPNFREFLGLPPSRHGRVDLLSLYDASLAELRESRPINLSVACRTQFTRPHLLERALLSFASAQIEAPRPFKFNVFLVSDVANDIFDSELSRWQERFPALNLRGLRTSPRSRETSRIDNLLAAISQIGGDYLWFVDDDDFIMPGALPSLARLLQPNSPTLFIGSSEVLEESWTAGQLRDFHGTGAHASKDVFDVFSGENFVPICGMILPIHLTRERCAGVQAKGEYLEDYFILMRVLTSPMVEVETIRAPIAGISLRGNENSVREVRRDTWDRSYSRFVGELMRDSKSSNPLLWQMARRY